MRRSVLLLAVLALALAGCALCEDAAPEAPAHSETAPVLEDAPPAPPAEEAVPPPPPPPPAAPPVNRMKKPTSQPRTAAPAFSLSKLNIKIADVDVVEQSNHFAKAVPSLAVFFAVNQLLRFIMVDTLNIKKFPHTLVGMLLVFVGLSASADDKAGKIVDFMEPSVTLITNFLPSFFVPALIVTPLAAQGLSGSDIARFLGVISLGLPMVLSFTGHLVQFLQKLAGQKPQKAQKPAAAAAAAPFKSWFSENVEKVFTAATVVSGGLSLAAPTYFTHPFYIITTFYSFIFASRIPRAFPPAVRQYWHPLLTTYSWATIILIAYSGIAGRPFFDVLKEYMVGGGHRFQAAGNFIMFLLEPSIISFGFGLYARRKLLFANFMPIVLGSFISTVAGIFAMAGLNRLFNPSRELKMALLPRATAALAVVQAAAIGASTSLTTVNCCITGIMGANFATKLNDLFVIADPVARGLATGCSGLALASAALTSTDPAAFPFGALGMALTSTWATILYSIPAFSSFIIELMGQHHAENPVRVVNIARQDSGFKRLLSTISKRL